MGCIILSGCSSSRQSPQQVQANDRESRGNVKLKEWNHDRALQHFIEGTALDAKGMYAEAILEYQEAGQYEPNAAISFAMSKDFWQLNKIERAVQEANNAVQLEPRNISYRENLATLFYQASRPDLAIREYKEIVKIDSSYSAGWFGLARLYQQVQPQQAIEIYEKMLSRDNNQMDVLLQCAQLYSMLERYDEAASKYRHMIELDPNNALLQKQLAETYAKGGRIEQAQALLDSVVQADTTDAEAIITSAHLALERKQFLKALYLVEILEHQNIKNTELRLQIGIVYFGLIEYDSLYIPTTITQLEGIQKDSPSDWRPYWYLGAIAANQHKDSLAGSYFEQVVKLENHHGDAWWYYGSSLFEQGKYDKLLEAMDQAQKLLPNDFRMYLLQGLALTRKNQQAEALQPLNKAYALNPNDLNVLSTLALTLDGMHNYQQSDSVYEQGIKQFSSSALLLNNYSYSLAERGLQLNRALEMSKQAITVEPDNAAYLDTYGWILFRLDKDSDAALYLEKSIATGKASSEVHEHLGDVYKKQGNEMKAIELWKKALMMDPNNEAAKQKLAGEGK